MKTITCECGIDVPACGMKAHKDGGLHIAALNRKEALKGRESSHAIDMIYQYDIPAAITCGYEIVSDAFYLPGCRTMPGVFHDGILYPKEQDWSIAIAEYRKKRKIIKMKEYRRKNRTFLLEQKKERYPIYRLQRLAKKALSRLGQEGEDDRIRITYPLLVAQAANGLIIRSEDNAIVQVVVKDTTTGLVHFLTIPPEFGNVPIEQCPVRGAMAERAVHAAIAWTFGMKPEEYSPEIEA